MSDTDRVFPSYEERTYEQEIAFLWLNCLCCWLANIANPSQFTWNLLVYAANHQRQLCWRGGWEEAFTAGWDAGWRAKAVEASS